MAETGCTSDPYVVGALLKSLRSRYESSRIVLIEGDATNTTADTLFGYLGISNIAKKFGCEVHNISRSDWVKVDIDGLQFRRVHVPRILTECDLYITHPKLKTHSLTKISCGLKNQFGCLRPKNKTPYHKRIDEVIVDANIARKPDFSIVDANLCMEGIGGPIHGQPKKVGLLIGGSDIVATDAFCSKIAGFRPFFIGHIRKAANKDLGEMKFSIQKNSALDLSSYRFKFNRLQYYALKLLRKRLR